MDFQFTPEQEQFRQEVKDFLEAEIKQGTFQPSCDAWIQGYSPEFTKKVAQKHWIGLTWPKEYGGQGRSHIDRLILTEELLRIRPDIPVLLCTGFGEHESQQQIKEIGIKALLKKPVAKHDLALVVRNTLDAQEQRKMESHDA